MNNILHKLLEIVKDNPTQTADALATTLSITRQSASRKLKGWVEDNLLSVSGRGRATRYALVEQVESFHFGQIDSLDEFLVYSQTLGPKLSSLPRNVLEAFQYGFTEMFNNAIDHSAATEIIVEIRQTPISTFVSIKDNGLGIFEKIQKAFGLIDIRQSIFELSKGKLTTDKANHSGEGIFFASKIFDFFCISSKGWAFVHNGDLIDVMYEHDVDYVDGTEVMFELKHSWPKQTKDIFDKFAMPEEYTFATTVVPVNLAKHEGEFLISRSQAKRLVARFEHFQQVILDFQNVASIGQAFADQIFRVYQNEHPDVQLFVTNATEDIQNMISRTGFKFSEGS
ncbi:hypothetical protein A4G20_06055 [Pasteurellaceae bacterium RH1A]|nr:hypothetical protein A4G20_06055 [Pasteurellaceae bacterium RH1A]